MSIKMEAEEVLCNILFLLTIPGLISNTIAILILNRKDMMSANNFLLKGIRYISLITQISYPKKAEAHSSIL